ncbi:MAG: hypothetical protein M1830_005751 [Pleopsidium flavum]|nr:MAG: hypothetical protein M1830_005751 [Pleopsidium flavum]
MKTTIALITALLSLLPSTQSAGQPSNNSPFTLIAAHSGSAIHLQSIEASSEHFFIGTRPSTYCPVPPLNQSDCPPGTSTAINVYADGSASLDVEVPGGQQIYISPTGALSYTPPHSHLIPAGSALGTFTHTTNNNPNSNLGHLTFTGLGATGFVACPHHNGTAPWQVFADVQGGDWGRCTGFDALSSEFTGGLGAWEYD